MIADVLVVARTIREIDVRTDDARFAAAPMAAGDFDGLDLWALLTGGQWPTVAAFLNDGTPVTPATAGRATAVINPSGRVGVVLGYGYIAAPAGREYLIGPYDPTQWSAGVAPSLVEYTGTGR